MDILKESISVLKNSNSYSEEECLDALDYIAIAYGRDISRALPQDVKTIAKAAQKDKRLKIRQAVLQWTKHIVLAKTNQDMPEIPAVMDVMLSVLKDDNPVNFKNTKGFVGSLFINEIHRTQYMALQVISEALKGHPKEASSVPLRKGIQSYLRKLESKHETRSLFRLTEEQAKTDARKILGFVQLMVASNNLGQPPSRKAYGPRSKTHKAQPRARDLAK